MHTQVVASSLRSHYHHYILNIGTCVCSGCCHMWCSSLCFLLSKNAVDMLTLHQHQVSGFQNIAFQIVVIISVLQQKCTRLQFFTNYVVMIDIVPADSFKYKWEKERLQKPLSSMVHVHAASPTATVYLSYRHSLTIWTGAVCVFGDICRAVWSYYWAQLQLTLTAFTYVRYINMHHIYKYNYSVWCFFSAHLTDMQLIKNKGHSLTTLTRGTFSHVSYFNQLNYKMDVKGS